jgi:acyl carrier protein
METAVAVETTPVGLDLAAAIVGLTSHLVTVKPSLVPTDVTPDSSLTADLGFDSLDLIALANEIRKAQPDFDLRTWLAGACQLEVDSVRALAESFTSREKTNVG